MADPFSLATGIISLVVVTLHAIAGASRMLDKTIAAHCAADEELEHLRHNLEELQRRMEINHERLEFLVSTAASRNFSKGTLYHHLTKRSFSLGDLATLDKPQS